MTGTVAVALNPTYHGDRKTQDVDADVEVLWAVHRAVHISGDEADGDEWTLTHVPTGYAVLSFVPRTAALACRAELLASPLDWSLPNGPKSLTPEHKAAGRALREKYLAD